MLFPTTIAGSLPKPAWLAEPNKLWAPWRLQGEELNTAKDDATLLAIKLQEDAGIDIVGDGEQARQHFVHGFLEAIDGIDFNKRVEMGIRNDRYKALCPTVVGELKLRHRVHAREARLARAHTKRKLKFTLPGPMTIVDTIADAHFDALVEIDAVDRLEKAVDEMLARLLAVADDIDAGVLLQLESEQRRVILGGCKRCALKLPRRPQPIGLREPGRLRQAAGDRGRE